MDLRSRFGANLRSIRLERGLTQEGLAFRSGLDRTEISLLERGGREPQLETIVKLAGALGISPNRLCEGIEWSVDEGLSIGGVTLPPGRVRRPRERRPSR